MACPVCGGPGTIPVFSYRKLRVRILAGGRIKKRIRDVRLRWDEPCLWCPRGQQLKGNWPEEGLP